MLPRDPPLPLPLLLLFCILYCHCYAQTTEVPSNITTTLNQSMILSAAMVCSMFSVVIILVPTVLYFRYCSKETSEE